MSFQLDIARFAAKAKGNVDLVVRKVCLDLFRRVIMRTPVDTGRARGNWLCAIASYDARESGTLDKTGAAAVSAMAATVQQVSGGEVIFLTNTLPYILRLEDGDSKQAPTGMVATTLTEFPGVVRTAGGGL